MKILIILPNWLGDAVMATPSIEALCSIYPEAELTLVGSYVSIEALKYHPQCKRHYVDETKKGGIDLSIPTGLRKCWGNMIWRLPFAINSTLRFCSIGALH